MKYDGPRHRGACAITETKDTRRKYSRPGLRVSLTAYYEGLRASHEAEKAIEKELDRIAQLEFCQDTKDINYLKLVYVKAHPRATFRG